MSEKITTTNGTKLETCSFIAPSPTGIAMQFKHDGDSFCLFEDEALKLAEVILESIRQAKKELNSQEKK